MSRARNALKALRREGLPALIDRLVLAKVRKYFALQAARKDGATLKSNVGPSRGLFLDCGSNLGQGFSTFKQFFPPDKFDYILIEPNPHCEVTLRQIMSVDNSHIELIMAAAATEEGTCQLFGLVEDQRGNKSDGASILKDHNSAFYAPNVEQAITVPKFSLANLILAKARQYAVIVMKLDVEGAEYEILPDLMEKGAADCLSAIYVEFHSQYMVEPNRQKYKNMEIEITKHYRSQKIPLRLWI
ncbi:FkbM family methyltransferase [Dyella monticola]|uniref:FkbM family methyltransferase n=1 Tax=Dyella monticola TaxID=1927958 RepID=A0A370X7Y4_9GAMM|nr:FkbM family methyltransferase [Dyella monticola]RDS84539.1 FkbM family methyltransferase [Dyella monticola]